MSKKQEYWDAYEAFYQAYRDDGWPKDRAEKAAERDAAHYVADDEFLKEMK